MLCTVYIVMYSGSMVHNNLGCCVYRSDTVILSEAVALILIKFMMYRSTMACLDVNHHSQ